jgi:hypothetical protein
MTSSAFSARGKPAYTATCSHSARSSAGATPCRSAARAWVASWRSAPPAAASSATVVISRAVRLSPACAIIWPNAATTTASYICG